MEEERAYYNRERRISGAVSDIRATANHFLPRSCFFAKKGKTVWNRPNVYEKGAGKWLLHIKKAVGSLGSHLITFLRTFLEPVVIEDLIDEYQIGVTKSLATIFFQIDIQGRCRTGKIMLYNPEDGHRVKDPEVPSRITWVHSLMKQAGMLPKEWELTQCLFGEHLLPMYPDKPVALVESEKTSIICAGLMPKYLWLATGGHCQHGDSLIVKGKHFRTACIVFRGGEIVTPFCLSIH